MPDVGALRRVVAGATPGNLARKKFTGCLVTLAVSRRRESLRTVRLFGVDTGI
jgi:hypothetical protein